MAAEKQDGLELWGTGGLLFSKLEAASIMRLAEGKPDESKEKAIDRLCDKKALLPTLMSGRRYFSRSSIERAIEKQTDSDAA